MSEKNRILVYLASVAQQTRSLVQLASVSRQTRSLVQLTSESRQTRSLVQLASSYKIYILLRYSFGPITFQDGGSGYQTNKRRSISLASKLDHDLDLSRHLKFMHFFLYVSTEATSQVCSPFKPCRLEALRDPRFFFARVYAQHLLPFAQFHLLWGHTVLNLDFKS